MSTAAVVGGGAAGMMAACTAAQAGHKVILIEHGERLGRKLSITGNGRCNLTNACPAEDLFDHFSANGKFLYSAVRRFDNRAAMDFFESSGLPLREESTGRVFPRSDRASDVVRTLENAMREAGVRVLLNTQAAEILAEGGAVRGIVTAPAVRGRSTAPDAEGPAALCANGDDSRVISCDAVIMATGGRSCPYTGSDGSGWEILKTLGHTLTPVRPALVGLRTAEPYIPKMQGISLNSVRLSVFDAEKKLFARTGDLLFTHQGISGPLAMEASSRIPDEVFYKIPDGKGTPGSAADAVPRTNLRFEIDLAPALGAKQLDARILEDFGENRNRRFKNSLGRLLPSGMIPVAVSLTGIAPDKRVNEVTREERERLISVIKHFPGTITGTGGWDEAVVTRGGISVAEINPSTMESGLVRGLYLCGEMMDVDGLSGGFNLQIAWSTGHLAGSSVGNTG